MAQEVITLRAEDGTTSRASAEVYRYSPGYRTLKAAAWIGGGIVGGGLCIIIPVLHLITTWALPLLGIVFGLRASRTHLEILQISGPCPACRASISMPGGGTGERPLVAPCPECEAPLTLLASESAAEAATADDGNGQA